MQARDHEIVARDRMLPGLEVVLEPGRLLEALQTAWPNHDLSDLQLSYLRYKPGTNCLAAYTLLVDGARTFVHATAHHLGDEAKLLKTRKKFRSESLLEPLVLPPHVAVRAFPTDRKLPALRCLADATERRHLLQKALPEHPKLWGAQLEVLRYKPERRLVARLRARDGSRALLKLYHAGDFERAQVGAEAFSRGAVLSAPLLGVHPGHCILIWRWLEATPCEGLLTAQPEVAADIGRALATLHAQPPADLSPVTRAEEALPLQAAAEHVAYLLPELAVRVRQLVDVLHCQLRTAPALAVPAHGDFSADQVLETPEGMAIIDFDAAALGDPAWDFGTFAAQLEHALVCSDFTEKTISSVQTALEAGYTAQGARLPPRIPLYTAAGLLRLAPHAFRTQQPDWPDETLKLVARAEALLLGI